MDETTTLVTTQTTSKKFLRDGGMPALVVAFAPPGVSAVDRCFVNQKFIVGRSAENDLVLRDGKVSRRHFAIS